MTNDNHIQFRVAVTAMANLRLVADSVDDETSPRERRCTVHEAAKTCMLAGLAIAIRAADEGKPIMAALRGDKILARTVRPVCPG